MIDYDKITEYMTTMGLNANGGFQLSAFAINEMLGNHYSISEKDLHDGVEWLKAKMKKEVEENPYWTTEHKENVKNGVLKPKNGVKLYLYVTHGIFSNYAIPKLLEEYDTIYTHYMKRSTYFALTAQEQEKVVVNTLINA